MKLYNQKKRIKYFPYEVSVECYSDCYDKRQCQRAAESGAIRQLLLLYYSSLLSFVWVHSSSSSSTHTFFVNNINNTEQCRQ